MTSPRSTTGCDSRKRRATRTGRRFSPRCREALPPFLASFERLQAIGAPDDPVLTDLVAHERAIDRFAELTLEGQGNEALAVLDAHLAGS